MARGSKLSRMASGKAPSLGRLLRSATEHLAADRVSEAEQDYARILAQEPANAAARYGLGLAAMRRGDPAQAVPLFVEALRLQPQQAVHWTALATALLASDRLTEARAILDKFRSWGFDAATIRQQIAPLARTLLDHAATLVQQGRPAEAEPRVDLVIALDDKNAAAIHLAGVIASRTKRPDQACTLFELAATLETDNATYQRDLGEALLDCGRKGAALRAFERVVELDPSQADAYARLADLNRQRGHLQAALRANTALLGLQPDAPYARNNRGVLLQQLGRPAEALALLEEAVARDPGDAISYSNLVQAALFTSPARALQIAAEFGLRYAGLSEAARRFANDPTPDRPLKVGFVSGDLREHPVSRFIEPFLQHHDRGRIEAFAYFTGEADATTGRLKPLFEGWREIATLDDDRAATLIQADGIDILVDLASHSADHRLLLFARKPAPVQVTWIGLPLTTGLAAIDYRLTDPLYDPEGSEDPLYAETLWRLPGVSYCYWPDRTAPEPAEQAPFQANGFITFGCLNRFEKVSPETLAVWSDLLRAVPDSRLLLIVTDPEDPDTQAEIGRRLTEAGIDPQRVACVPRSGTEKYALHGQVDIALDPFPFNGGTTSYDTLHMGVPYVALRGGQTLSRMGAAVLAGAGLHALVAETTADYVAIAAGLAGDPARLLDLRRGLRDRLRASPHMDHVRHAREVEAAFAGMWRRWCAAQAGEAAAATA